MAWQYVPDSKYKKTITYRSGYGGTIYLYLQYDDATISSTSVNVRWEISCGGQGATSGNSWNHYFLLIYPDDSTKRSLYTIKNSWTEGKSGGYPWRGPAYTLTKGATASSYSLPPIWLINDGYDNTDNDATTMYDRYKPGGDRAAIASGNLVNRYPVESISGFAGIRSDATAGTIEIIDNFNNTFKVKGGYGEAGVNNAISKHVLWWAQTLSGNTWNWYDSYAGHVDATSNPHTSSDISLKLGAASSATITVKASMQTVAAHNSPEAQTTKGIKQYRAPTNHNTIPKLIKTKPRLTIREPWTFEWYGATQANGSSPVKGYNIKILKNDTELTGLVLSSDKKNITKGIGSNTSVEYNSHATTMQVSIDPKALGFKAKDKVNFKIQPFTRYGDANNGGQLPSSTWTALGNNTIQSAGVIRVYDKEQKKFVEGIACVYNGTTKKWDEAESVRIYQSGSWDHESI